jgi:hypothetical protein
VEFAKWMPMTASAIWLRDTVRCPEKKMFGGCEGAEQQEDTGTTPRHC